MRNLLGDGANEEEYEIINGSVSMEDATQYDNGYGGVMNYMDLGYNGAASQYFPNIRLRGIAIDYGEDHVD